MAERFIAHYRITGKLGAGGMGEVLLARDTKLDREVAIKLLPSEVAQDRQRRQRFMAEARAASALNHPNVCTIFDVGETSDHLPYIVMEHVVGQTLDRHDALDCRAIVDVGLQVADALDCAHSQGIIHRDIKPSNITLTQRGQVKILDFGLAKRLNSNSDLDVSTEPGRVLGTPSFMSPEQALGQPVDHRTDIFSFGVVLYQLTTGRLPFGGSNIVETTHQIVHGQPATMTRRHFDVPAELERLVFKCLEKEPDRRYQSVRELRVDLAALRDRLNRSAAGMAQVGAAGVVTLLLTDLPRAMTLKTTKGVQESAAALKRCGEHLKQLSADFPTAGELQVLGDTFLVTFARPSAAVEFALRSRAAEPGGRFAIHLGEVGNPAAAEPAETYGATLEVAARLLLLDEGRILVTRAVFDNARAVLRGGDLTGLRWLNHGPYLLDRIDPRSFRRRTRISLP